MSSTLIAENIYHVGDVNTRAGLDCNPYLLIDGDEGVLFDPGSVIDYEIVYKNVCELINPDKVKYIVLHHQDADFCSAVPLLEKKGIHAKIVTAWRTMTLVQYYDIRSEYYLIEEHNYQLTLDSGRLLKFLPTPYMHFPGAFTTYDEVTKSLLSSDVFGAFSYNRTFYADDTYIHKMLAFHEHYMPSNEIVRPVMDMFLEYDIQRILPQHGAIIKQDIKKHIMALRELECGALLHPIKKELLASGGFKMIFNEVYQRYSALYDGNEVKNIFERMGCFTFDENGNICDYNEQGEVIWEKIFEWIHEARGSRWITVVDPFVKKLCAIYGLKIPSVINTLIDSVQDENLKLKEQNEKLDQNIREIQNRLIRCPVTNLFNEVFLDSIMFKELEGEDWREIGNFAAINVDQLVDIKFQFGDIEYKNTLISFAYYLREAFGDNAVFRLQSSEFGVYLAGIEKKESIQRMDDFRMVIESTIAFIMPITLSIGLVFSDEIEIDAITYESALAHYKEVAFNRLNYAQKNGKNMLRYLPTEMVLEKREGKVLIVDADETSLDVLKTFLTDSGIHVLVARDGDEAAYIAETEIPILIISEVMLPKSDGFILREKLLAQSLTKEIDMIYLSYLKDEKSIKRALALGVTQFIKKPYMLSELIGIAKKKVKEMM